MRHRRGHGVVQAAGHGHVGAEKWHRVFASFDGIVAWVLLRRL
jgi:hypothetical protein